MKIGLLSDAHGNPEGLARCLALLERKGAQQLYFLGDAVGYFSGWAEVLRLLKESEAVCLLGNHDDYALHTALPDKSDDAYQMLSRYLETIEPYKHWMETWRPAQSVTLAQRTINLFHGSPENPLKGYIYPWTDTSGLSGVRGDVVVMGHTHRPFIKKQDATILMNVGSCGLPRDVGGLASCAIIDTDALNCTVYRTPFDSTKLLSRVGYVHPDVLQCLSRTSPRYVGVLAEDFSD